MPRLVLVDTSAGIVKKACGCHRSHSSGHSEDSWESGGFFAPPLPPSPLLRQPYFTTSTALAPAPDLVKKEPDHHCCITTTRLPPMPPQLSLPLFTHSISSIFATRDPGEATTPQGRSLVRGQPLFGPRTLRGRIYWVETLPHTYNALGQLLEPSNSHLPHLQHQ